MKIGFALVLSLGAGSALAAECPGNPDAIGTSRNITIDPSDYALIGTVNYEESLPLRDHELVLTFDDGPLSPYTPQVLDALAAECVKATFFIVGEMARDAPELVRRVSKEGHSIGTHTQTHPHLPKLSFHNAKKQIEDGIQSVIAALGDAKAVSPFFRAPYLEMTDRLEHYLGSRKIAIWSIDFQADDWEPISSDQVVALALKRIEQSHRGILLLHDAEPRTPAAVVKLLRELKVRGYRIVHVDAAGPNTTSSSSGSFADDGAHQQGVTSSHVRVQNPEPKIEDQASPSKSAGNGGSSDRDNNETTGAPAAIIDKNNGCKERSSVIGTSRVIVADPYKFAKVGTLQFSSTLPLEDHEVVLTFDDGPLSPETDKILDALASQCVKATFFVVGAMVKESPDSLRRAYAEGHTIGTASESHPYLTRLPLKQAKREIATGIAAVAAALPGDGAVSPFFRAPYLETTPALDAYLASQHLMLWSVDAQADDWQDITPDQVVERAIASIEKKRKGILMLYDIQPQTAAALPKLLSELTRRGYRFVHVEAPTQPLRDTKQ